MEDKGRKEEKGGWKKEDAREEREQVSAEESRLDRCQFLPGDTPI